MEPKRTLHSGNLVRGDRKLFMETMGKENHNIIKNSAGL